VPTATTSAFRGSRKHILDWLDSASFLPELNSLLTPPGAVVRPDDHWMPKGSGHDREARVGAFRRWLPSFGWDEVEKWWLAHPGRGNTPNWDLAATCRIGKERGLVLIEAKANEGELKRAGKRDPAGDIAAPASPSPSRSSANHARISSALSEACQDLQRRYPAVRLSIDGHYQLANRVAFAWRIASLGIPVVLVYLGFLGDRGLRRPFHSHDAWVRTLQSHAADVFPGALWEVPIQCIAAAPFWFLARSRPVIEDSPPARQEVAGVGGDEVATR
jgi:hypothetical protein